MNFNLNKIFEKTQKLSSGILLFLVLISYAFKNIFYFYSYSKEFPALIQEFTGQSLEVPPIAIALGFMVSSLIIMFIVRLVINFIYMSLRQRGLINEDIKGFSNTFYLCYIMASVIVGVVNIFAFLAPEIMLIGNSVITLIVHSFFYLTGYIYVNKYMIKPDYQSSALKLVSTIYLVYFYLTSIFNTVLFANTLDLVLGIISILLTGGLHLIINKMKVNYIKAETNYREEVIKKSMEQQKNPKEEEKKEIFKGFGF